MFSISGDMGMWNDFVFGSSLISPTVQLRFFLPPLLVVNPKFQFVLAININPCLIDRLPASIFFVPSLFFLFFFARRPLYSIHSPLPPPSLPSLTRLLSLQSLITTPSISKQQQKQQSSLGIPPRDERNGIAYLQHAFHRYHHRRKSCHKGVQEWSSQQHSLLD